MANMLFKTFLRKHGADFALRTPDGHEFNPIVELDDGLGSQGWGCVCCEKAAAANVIKKSVWSQRRYLGNRQSFLSAAPSYSIEILRRHANLTARQADGRAPMDKGHEVAVEWMKATRVAGDLEKAIEASEFEAPSKSQIRIAMELAHGQGGKYLRDYPRRCDSERRRGSGVPHTRSSIEVGRNIVMAAAAVEYEHDRSEILPTASECAWAQDKADELLLMKYRAVHETSWEVQCRVIDAVEPNGDRAIQCQKDMAHALDGLCTRVGEVLPARSLLGHAKDIFRNASADGEPTEQLALRLFKEVCPNMDFITRAEEHSAVLVLNKATKSCEYVAALLVKVIHGFTKTSNGHAKTPGGFARFVTTSHKLRRKYKIEALEKAATAAVSLCTAAGVAEPQPGARTAIGFCMPRFDSIVDPLEAILRNLRVTIAVLADEAADPTGFQNWAHGLLVDVFNFADLVLLGLTCDILICGRAWVHGRDQTAKGTLQSICRSQGLNAAFLKDLDALIMRDNPIALSKGYSLGVANKVIHTLKDSVVIKGIPQGQRSMDWPGTWAACMAPLSKARVLVKWITAHMHALFVSGSLQEAMAPFDLLSWKHDGADAEHDLVMKAFAPLAAARGADVEKAACGYFRVRNLAKAHLAAGARTPVEYWQPALRDRRRKPSTPTLRGSRDR